MRSLREEIREASRAWSTLTIYGRFEQFIVLILSVLIAIVVLSATWHLAVSVGALILTGHIDPASQGEFQRIFGMIVIVLIALEFEHSLLVDTVHHRLEGLRAEEFVGRLPCAATPSVIVNDKHAVRDEPMIEMHQLVQR
jgi:hypothetical protein